MKTDDAAIEIGSVLQYDTGGGIELTKRDIFLLTDLTESDWVRGLAMFKDVFQLKDGGSPIVCKYDPLDKAWKYRIAQTKYEAPAYAAKRAKSLKTQTIRLSKTIDASIMKFGQDPVIDIHKRILQRQREGLDDLIAIADLEATGPNGGHAAGM